MRSCKKSGGRLIERRTSSTTCSLSRTGSAAEFSELDINQVLDDTIHLIELQLRRNQIEITRDYEVNTPLIIGNAGNPSKSLPIFAKCARRDSDGGRITLRTSSRR
jgi:hypothetical protein